MSTESLSTQHPDPDPRSPADEGPILEHALLEVGRDDSSAFEAAFADARPLIEATPGFRRLRLEHSIETPGRYLLLVEWDRLEDHTEGFRRSGRYERWSALLHPFYEPFPTVEHYRTVRP